MITLIEAIGIMETIAKERGLLLVGYTEFSTLYLPHLVDSEGIAPDTGCVDVVLKQNGTIDSIFPPNIKGHGKMYKLSKNVE